MRYGKAIGLSVLMLGIVAGSPIVPIAKAEQAIAQTQSNEIDQAIDEGLRLWEKGSKESLVAAIEKFKIALQLSRIEPNKVKQATALAWLGRVHHDLSDKQKALDYYNQALPIFRAVGDRSGEATTLNNIGSVYNALGELQKALDYYNQAVPILRAVSNRLVEARTLNNIGLVYNALGEMQKALDYYNQALPILRAVGDRSMEATTLNNIGLAYNALGDQQKALYYYNQALPILREVSNRLIEATTLNNIGFVYDVLGDQQKALYYYNQALPIRRAVGDRSGEATTLNNIGLVYDALGEKQKALDYYNQALSILRAVGDRSVEARTLNNIGIVYDALGDRQKALDYYNQALPILRAVGYRSGEAKTLNNIGALFGNQNQAEAAIVFYKQSVTVYEQLRSFIQKLSPAQQATYTQSIASTYRDLATLLLQQNRIMEALQVLDLLKEKELQDYLPDRKTAPIQASSIDLLPQERIYWNRYAAIMQPAIDRASEFNDLIRLTQPTQPQSQRLTELKQIQQQIPEQLNQYQSSSEANALITQLKTTAVQQNLSLPSYQNTQAKVKILGKHSALLYPLLLDDRIELVILTPDRLPIHKSVPITRKQLESTIAQFRNELSTPNSNPKPTAQQLYTWLIQPIEAELQSAGVKTIVYAPDGKMRYIPLAALHDGKQWLAERYQVNYLTALSLTQLDKDSTTPPKILAAARTSDLTYSRPEVEQIAKDFPNTTALFDLKFDRSAILSSIPNNDIIHLATHATFGTNPDDSFIRLGNTDIITLRELDKINFGRASLVVLSACQTAQGDTSQGLEILGFGYQLQRANVRASIASLWSVNDGGTQTLMNAFYGALKTGKYTKVEALQEAQKALITSDFKAVGGKREARKGGAIGLEATPERQAQAQKALSDRLNHPFYWAPFILIGNGL